MIEDTQVVKVESRNVQPVSTGATDVKVKATKKGYHLGERYPGDVFTMPRKKGGALPTGSWFELVDKPADAVEVADVDDMA